MVQVLFLTPLAPPQLIGSPMAVPWSVWDWFHLAGGTEGRGVFGSAPGSTPSTRPGLRRWAGVVVYSPLLGADELWGW